MDLPEVPLANVPTRSRRVILGVILLLALAAQSQRHRGNVDRSRARALHVRGLTEGKATNWDRHEGHHDDAMAGCKEEVRVGSAQRHGTVLDRWSMLQEALHPAARNEVSTRTIQLRNLRTF